MSIIIKFSFSVSVNDSRYTKGEAKKKALGRSCKFRESTPMTRTKFWLNYNGHVAKFEAKRWPRSGLFGYCSKTRIETRTRVIFNQLFLQYNMMIFFFFVLTNCSSVVSSVRTLIAEDSSRVIFGLGIEEISEQKMSNRNTETRSLMDELRSFERGGFFDLGHPLLNRIAESFFKAAGIGAIQAVSREAYFTAIESAGIESGGGMPSEISGGKKHRLPNLKGETNRKSLEAMVKNTGKESIQWGLAAGVYSGLTYGLTEARGAHDWKNSAVAGAVTGVALALTSEDSSHEQIVQCAITGAAISTAANLLAGIF